ncbi:MAG: SPOR domain-containing protein [Bacteroidales bacterium]|jgi:hypothetical protein|nr:SPOR domain-containing protein [Bacteroidales bacterium]
MKPIRIVTILLAASLLFSGCDFFRSILGKPTSKEIEAARIEQEAAEAARRDSIARAEEQARLAAEAAARPVYSNYYVIMGCYKIPANAQRLKAKLEAKGYDVAELRFKNGYDVVAIQGSETFREAYRHWYTMLERGDEPYDMWIYQTSMALHE